MPSFDPSKLDTAAKVFNKAMHPSTPPAEAAAAAARYEALKARYGFTDADMVSHINANTPPPRGGGAGSSSSSGGSQYGPGSSRGGGGSTPPPNAGGGAGGAGGGGSTPPPGGGSTGGPSSGPSGNAWWANNPNNGAGGGPSSGATGQAWWANRPNAGASGGASGAGGASAAAGAAQAGASGQPFDFASAWKAGHTPPDGGATPPPTGSVWSQGMRSKVPGASWLDAKVSAAPGWMSWAPWQNSSSATVAGLGRGLVSFGLPIAAHAAGGFIDKRDFLGMKADSAANDAVAAALHGAGYGAMIGSFAGLPWLGAGIGAAAGAGYSLLKNDHGESNNDWLSKLGQMRDRYGVNPDDYNDIIRTYNLELDMAEDPNDPTVLQTAKDNAKKSFQLAAQGLYESPNGGGYGFGRGGDALAMQALIGNYVKPYTDMSANLGNQVNDAYAAAANQMSDPNLANLTRAAGRYNQQHAVEQAGAIMGATMVDPQLLAAQKQADLLQKVSATRQSDPLAGL